MSKTINIIKGIPKIIMSPFLSCSGVDEFLIKIGVVIWVLVLIPFYLVVDFTLWIWSMIDRLKVN